MLLYNLLILPTLYILTRFSSLISHDVRLFLRERQIDVDLIPPKHKKRVWFHFSSAGEYEYAKPLIDKFYLKDYELVVTYFSRSFVKTVKDYSKFTYHSFLPLDFSILMSSFVKHVDADKVFLVKYDLWPNMISAISKKKTPLYLISAHFHGKGIKSTIPFISSFYKNLYNKFDKIFVVSKEDKDKFINFGVSERILTVAGDTRVDRVLARKEIFTKTACRSEIIEYCNDIESWKTSNSVNARTFEKPLLVVFGSVWLSDMVNFVKTFIEKYSNKNVKFLLAPHKVDEKSVSEILKQLQNFKISVYSEGINPESQILIFDKIGALAEIYSLADIAYVGGGFNKEGVHSILEPMAYGLPVIYGDNFQKSPEGKLLISKNFSERASFSNDADKFDKFFDEKYRKNVRDNILEIVNSSKGATDKIGTDVSI